VAWPAGGFPVLTCTRCGAQLDTATADTEETMTPDRLTPGDRAALIVACPICGAMPGHLCTTTENGKRGDLPYTHYRRNDNRAALSRSGGPAPC